MNTTSSRPETATREQPTFILPKERLHPADDILEYATTYARQNPGTAALWCFGIGFILGWKLKPW